MLVSRCTPIKLDISPDKPKSHSVSIINVRVVSTRSGMPNGLPTGSRRHMKSTTIIAQRFELGPRIGAGAMGAVHSGVDRQTGEPVAIKILRSDLVTDMPDVLERFRREGDVLRRLNHPNIVKVLATADEDDT